MIGTPSAGTSVAGMAAENASLAEATAARKAEALMLTLVQGNGCSSGTRECSPTACRSPLDAQRPGVSRLLRSLSLMVMSTQGGHQLPKSSKEVDPFMCLAVSDLLRALPHQQ